MRFFRLFGRSVRRRVEAVAIIPVVVAVLVLTLFNVGSRMQAASDAIDELGTQSTRYLASRAELPLYSGNLIELQHLIEHADLHRDVAGVAMLDAELEPILASEGFPWPRATPETWHRHQDQRRYRYYLQPVVFASIDVEDYQDPTGALESLAGYSLLAIDLSATRKLWHYILLSSLGLALGAIALAGVLSHLLAKSITAPIRQYSRALQALQQGELETRVTATTRDELAILAEGINELARSVQEGQRNLQANVDKATHQLQRAMADLRQKNLELEQARRHAEQSAESKGEFLARMSHELRTPLTAISGFLKLIDHDQLGLKERHYCTIIEQSTKLLLKHIDDILAFSRLSSNQVILDEAPFALDETFASIITQLRHNAVEKGLELFINIADDVHLSRHGDSFRLHQVVSNLVSNALKFTDEGWIEVAVTNGPGDSICIEVTDTGIGIRPDRLNDIFNPFAQGDTSTTRRFGGTGLGLPIVKSLVELMGGGIQVQSTVGEGTRFVVTLPLPPCADQPDPTPLDLSIALFLPEESQQRDHFHTLDRCFTNLHMVHSPTELFEPAVQSCEVLIIGLRVMDGQLSPLQEIILTRWEKPLVILTTPGVESRYYQHIVELRGDKPLAILSPMSLNALIDGVRQAAESGPRQLICHPPGQDEEVLAGLKFLIAEDNQFTRLLLEELISRHGGDFTSATNGYEALQHAQQEPYDLLLVDVHMPDLGGQESIRRIRQQGTVNREAPIIALTADILQQDQQALFKAGANALLFKPLDEKALLETIVQLCHQTDRSAAIASQAQTEAPEALLPRYRAELHRLLFLCREAWQANDETELREILHQLLGVAGVFRRPELAEQVKRSHRSLREGGLSSFVSEFETLEAMMEAEISAD